MHDRDITESLQIPIFLIVIGFAVSAFCSEHLKVYAVNQYQNPTASIYEVKEGPYDTDERSSVAEFSYGKSSLGVLTVSGGIDSQTKYNGWNAYLSEDTVTFNYKYDGSFQSKVKENWELKSDDTKAFDGQKLSRKIGKGVVLIQKSTDGKKWEDAEDPIVNFFADNVNGKDGLYSAPVSELKQGTYYRITVAYLMTRKTGTKETIPDIPVVNLLNKIIPESDDFSDVSCVEQYEFFLYYGGNPLVLNDIVSRSEITGSTVQKGFVLTKDGSTDKVTVSENGRSAKEAEDYSAYYEPGEYEIEITPKIGEKIKSTIEITDGLKMTSLSPEVYVSGAKDSYDDGELEERSTPAEIRSLTSLKIGQTGSDNIEQSDKNGIPVYGINGNGVSIFMSLSGESKLSENGWNIVSDDWGKKKNQTIGGTYTGAVLSGALIIQTSSDQKNWKDISRDKYANGLMTTDFAESWADKNDICIYIPDGGEVKQGIYIRVLYAYKAQNIDNKKSAYRSYEKYEFYLCNSQLGAVTFHNLTLNNIKDEVFENEENDTVNMCQNAETLTSGSETVTGFEIDTSLNPNISYTIYKEGKQIAASSDNKYTDSGKYDIHLKSPAGNERDVILYVDSQSNEEALKYYFGESFISGKRIYSEGGYPVFEGGSAHYNIQSVGEEYLPVSGQIVADSDEFDEIDIPASRESKTGVLTVPGNYTAILKTNTSNNSDSESGDSRIFEFHFSIIAEGSAPGPVINQKSLEDYSHSSISDSYPIYYGLTYQSALKGRITLAFSTEEGAIEYAYNYEKGTVEKQGDGTYRYIGTSQGSQKNAYDSVWNLTDDINAFAKEEVKKYYFDLSDEFTYRTLTEETLNNVPNLRALELENSIIVFANEDEKSRLTSLKSLPLLSPKPYSYIQNAGNNETLEQGKADFEFIKDKYGIDSNMVSITDKNGKVIPIAYDCNVGQQLSDNGCATGEISVTETTAYGDSKTYKAVFINQGENTAVLSLDYYEGNKKRNAAFTQNDDGISISADAFSINQITDELDPYDLILITKDGNNTAFVADQTITDAWSDPGEYEVKIINRLGYSYTINVNIENSSYTTISFLGEGTQNIQAIVAQYGQKNIELPELTRKGYELVGFIDQKGNMYGLSLPEMTSKDSLVLTAQWKPIKCKVTLKDSSGNILSSETVDFGTEYELRSKNPESSAGTIVWLEDGEKVHGASITVEDEDVVLTALMGNDTEDDKQSIGTENNSDSKTHSAGSASGIAVLLVLAAAIAGVILHLKRNVEG